MDNREEIAVININVTYIYILYGSLKSMLRKSGLDQFPET